MLTLKETFLLAFHSDCVSVCSIHVLSNIEGSVSNSLSIICDFCTCLMAKNV
jgi:hypothetical protein